MQEVHEFLATNTTVFLATVDQGSPRVRPFQYQFETGGRLWFCTAKSKEVFGQLCRNPELEISCTSKDMTTLRLKGEAVLDDDMAIKERIIKENPMVGGIYGSADNPEFTVFSVDHGSALLFDFSGDPPRSFTF